MPSPIDMIVVRGTTAQFDSIPNLKTYSFRLRQAIDNKDGTFSVEGYGNSADQSYLSGLGFTVAVLLTQAQMDQHELDIQADLPPSVSSSCLFNN